MKKLLALLLTLIMMLSLVACNFVKSEEGTKTEDGNANDDAASRPDNEENEDNGENEEENEVENEEEAPSVSSAEAKIQAYLAKNSQTILASMEASFATSSGLTCTSSIKAENTSIVIGIHINELENVDAATKQALQDAYDLVSGNFVSALKEMQKEIPELEAMVINVCDKNGEVLAVINARDDGAAAPEVDLTGMTVEEYVDLFGDVLLDSMEASFATSSGLTCTSSVKAENNNIVVCININEMENVDAATKQTLQETYDSMGSAFEEMVSPLKSELSDLNAVIINVCDKNGDVLAVITAEA